MTQFRLRAHSFACGFPDSQLPGLG